MYRYLGTVESYDGIDIRYEKREIVKFVLRDSAPLIKATTREIAARIAHASVAACLTTLPT